MKLKELLVELEVNESLLDKVKTTLGMGKKEVVPSAPKVDCDEFVDHVRNACIAADNHRTSEDAPANVVNRYADDGCKEAIEFRKKISGGKALTKDHFDKIDVAIDVLFKERHR